jgi:radical SAM protein with 4Fe4S-binding SPASM domain
MQTWVDMPIDELRIGIDAIDPKLYDQCRPGRILKLDGDIYKQKRRIGIINKKIEHWLSIKGNIKTRLVFTKSSINETNTDAFLDFWIPKLEKTDCIFVKRVLSYGGKIKDPYIKPYKCNIWQARYFVIGWDGRTSPCNLDINLKLNLGNIMDRSIEELYTSERSQELRKTTGCKNNIEPCNTCLDSNGVHSKLKRTGV